MDLKHIFHLQNQLDAPTGPRKGMPDIANAADEAIIDNILPHFLYRKKLLLEVLVLHF